MGFQVSPGVVVQELDLTNVIPAISTSIGGYAGHFRWGPTEELVFVSSEKELAAIFGAPNATFSTSFLQAASFLKYASTLLISRAKTATMVNACTASMATPTYIKDIDYITGGTVTDTGIFARYAGAMGNGLKIIMVDSNVDITGSFSPSVIDDVLGYLSEGTPEAGSVSIVILDGNGEFTGTADAVLEVYENVSLTAGAVTEDGTNNYYVDVINTGSQYAFIVGDVYTESLGVESPTDGVFYEVLAGGVDGTKAVAEVQSALDLFADADLVDVNLLFAEGGGTYTAANEAEIAKYAVAICEARKDCLAFASAPAGTDGVQTATSNDARYDIVNNYFNAGGSPFNSSSYVVFDSTPVYTYNKYLDTYNWIPAAGHAAGLCANTDDVAEPWFSPAGYNRGNLKGVTKLAFNPDLTYRNALYKGRINPIVAFPGQGILLFGDKTGQSKASAFDRINVRRLFIVLEKAIATAAKYQLFELNDEFTRAMFRNMVEPFLRDVKGRRGVTDFAVVCDETNNTGQVIDSNRFVADIYIKPSRSINFMTLNFIATRTGVEFSEIVGK